jgi:hypothetical protein
MNWFFANNFFIKEFWKKRLFGKSAKDANQPFTLSGAPNNS